MSKVANKSTLYAVMRKEVGHGDVVCCFTKTLARAEELCGEYEQRLKDSGGSEYFYFYVVGNIFYDQ